MKLISSSLGDLMGCLEALNSDPIIITTWRNTSVRITTTPSLFYDFLVDWGNGVTQSQSGFGPTVSRSYPDSDFKTVTITGDSFPGFNINGNPSADNIISVDKYEGFPILDAKTAFHRCKFLISVPFLDLSQITNSDGSFIFGSCERLTYVPPMDFSKFTKLRGGWLNCRSLTAFPLNSFDNSICSDLSFAFRGCGLDQESVDGILISVDLCGVLDGKLDIDGGSNSTPSSLGLTAKTNLTNKGWVVNTN